jgi:2,4-dienoyl-CoA reductase-like NADH-dependent reductase (Old Yellow Enzyme family)
VARQIQAVRQLRAQAPRELLLVGTGYSYLQEYLPHVAQYVLRHGWADFIGIGRAVLSYPEMLADALEKGVLNSKVICRTFSDCTTGPRKGLISGCYPLDKYYSSRPEAAQLKQLKKES